jgi:anhydro-N-acetylmuramic acid kinase
MPKSNVRYFVGLMSGTSVDAIDAALVEVTGRTPKLTARVLHHHERPWPSKLQKRILAVMAPAAATTQEICELNVLIAREFATAATNCLKYARMPAKKIAALASHGQTVCHLPPGSEATTYSTLQLGDPSVIATLSGIATVGNFRPADMALGGQGAPLVPFADAMLFGRVRHARCVQNIGGIANVTYLPSGQWSVVGGQKVVAFDTGPGNMLIDALITLATKGKKRFDAGGAIAAQGQPDAKLLRKLQAHPYFKQQPPKSTGRELFGTQVAEFLLATDNRPLTTLLATATHLTAWSIAHSYRHFLPELPREVILCGGGADNLTLVKLIANYLAALRPEHEIKVSRIDDYGIPNKSKEAASFALLAAATLDAHPGNVPSVTGASRPAVLGVVARP